MVAYQGDVTFEHAGSGGMGRMLKKAVTGEGTTAHEDHRAPARSSWPTQAQDIHLIYLENEKITVNGPNLLAFDADIDWDIERVQGASGVMGGGLFNTALQGTGWVAILSDGPPVLLNVGRRADVRRRPGRDHVVPGRDHRVQDRLQDEEPDRPRLGRDRSRWPSRARAGCSSSRPRAASRPVRRRAVVGQRAREPAGRVARSCARALVVRRAPGHVRSVGRARPVRGLRRPSCRALSLAHSADTSRGPSRGAGAGSAPPAGAPRVAGAGPTGALGSAAAPASAPR